MIAYTFSFLFIGGFYCLTFRNSPKYATIVLLIVAISIGIGFIKPRRETSTLIGLAVGTVGAFTVVIQSRKERERLENDWFAGNGFSRINFPGVDTLFNTPTNGEISYYAYKGKLTHKKKVLPFIVAIRHTSSVSDHLVSVVFECSYYFSGIIDVELLEKKFVAARETTPHTAFFDMKKCEIFRPSPGGIVVSWRIPDMIAIYNARYEWIKNAVQY